MKLMLPYYGGFRHLLRRTPTSGDAQEETLAALFVVFLYMWFIGDLRGRPID